jgi:hypothetical protein
MANHDIQLLGIGTRVKLRKDKGILRTGKIIGHSFVSNSSTSLYNTRIVFLVQLDEGFYSPDQDTFVSVLVCAPDTVIET